MGVGGKLYFPFKFGVGGKYNYPKIYIFIFKTSTQIKYIGHNSKIMCVYIYIFWVEYFISFHFLYLTPKQTWGRFLWLVDIGGEPKFKSPLPLVREKKPSHIQEKDYSPPFISILSFLFHHEVFNHH